MIKNLIISCFCGLMLTGCYAEMVDSGEVGVQINSGVVSDTPIKEGFNFSINPLAQLITYNVKAKQVEMSTTTKSDTDEIIHDSPVTILTKDNMQIPIDITILYKLKDDCAPHIRKEFGVDITWDNKVIVPVARDTIRSVIGKDADVYALNLNREKYANEIKTHLEERVNSAIKKQCVMVDMVSIRDIKLPQSLMDSIIKKNQMEEEFRRAELEVKKARAEAEIEIAKKEGIAKGQLALSKSITKDLIEWKRLEISQDSIAKWNGVLPSTVLGESVPFVNVK